MKKVFLICMVRDSDEKHTEMLLRYATELEWSGYRVHYPKYDTEQNDPSGGFEICQTNFKAIIEADEIHIFYDESSAGSKFDMGGLFMLVAMLGISKKIYIPNLWEAERADKDKKKSFLKVFKYLELLRK